jgi:thioredoxin-like negative regulator of GroEL
MLAIRRIAASRAGRAYCVASVALQGGIPPRAGPPGSRPATPPGAPAPPSRPQGIIGADGSVMKAGGASAAVNKDSAAPVDKLKAARDRREKHAALMEAASKPPPSPIVEVTSKNFAEEVLDSSVPAILYCTASWCSACKELSPMLEKIVMSAGGMFKLAKMDADNEENQAILGQLQVRSLPTVFGVVGGKVVDQFVGLQPAQRMQQFFTAMANAAQQQGMTPSPAGDPASAAVTTINESSSAVDDGDATFALEALPSTIEMLQRLYSALHKQLSEQAMEKAAVEKKEPLPVRTDVGPLADCDTLLARAYSVMLRALLAEAQRGIALASSAGTGTKSGPESVFPPPIMSTDDCFKQAHSVFALLTSPRFKPYHKDELVARGVSAGELAKNAEEGE